MPRTFGEVAFTLTDLRIAAYNILLSTYGTAVPLSEAQTLEFSPAADNDSIKAGGRLRHLLSVATHVEFKLSGAGIDFVAYNIFTGMANTSSGSSPNQGRKLTAAFDGLSLPYFGLVGKLVSEAAADLHIGLPVCMLDAIPGLKTDQNKFIMSEASGKGIARESDNKGIIILAHETALAVNFNEIFA